MSEPPGIVDGRLSDIPLLREGPLADVLALLNRDGEEARLVGGAVRDLMLAESPGDFDVGATATPDVVTRRARAAGLDVIPTGIAHGTVTVMARGAPIEVTTLREDIETDGRHAVVRFGRDFRRDALRRDFTINALSLDVDGRVHDYCGGLEDLEARRVRFIGDARQRIREDFLRILRFFRFSARFGEGTVDPEGFSAAIRERDGLMGLSRERVRAELFKGLVAPRAGEVFARVCDAGLLGTLFAGALDPARLRRLIAIEDARDAPADPVRRLAALAAGIAEDADRLRDRLRLSNFEHERLAAMAKALETLHGLREPPGLGELRILLFERGRRGARDAMSLVHADSGASPADPRFASADRFLADTPEPRLPFTGADIVARGVGPGRRVGEVLKALQAMWIRAGFPREPGTLAKLLDDALNV
jgi:poly(A) polymerase